MRPPSSGLAGAVAVHRGCGVADFNNDGRLDLAVLVLGARPELWQNGAASDRRWLIVRLVGTKSNRDGIGARVIVGNQVRTMTTAARLRLILARRACTSGWATATEVDRAGSPLAVRHAPDRRKGEDESGD